LMKVTRAKVSLQDGDIWVTPETLKKIKYFEAFLRFPSNKQLSEIDIEIDCKKSIFQDFIAYVENGGIKVKPETVSGLYDLANYFGFLELSHEIAFQSLKLFFVKEIPVQVPWLTELLSHPNFDGVKYSIGEFHQCLLVNPPGGFRIRGLKPECIPNEIFLSRPRSKDSEYLPMPTLPRYYSLKIDYSKGKNELLGYYSRPSVACSDMREALQFYNFQHGNSQSRTGITKNMSCRFIYIPEDRSNFNSFGDLLVERIHQKYSNIKASWHRGNSWDFHLNGGNPREYAITITGSTQDILLFFRQAKHQNITQVSLNLHIGQFNRIFQFFSSFGYDEMSNSIFFIRSVSEIKKVLKILSSDESKLVKLQATKIVFLPYYPRVELFPI